MSSGHRRTAARMNSQQCWQQAQDLPKVKLNKNSHSRKGEGRGGHNVLPEAVEPWLLMLLGNRVSGFFNL